MTTRYGPAADDLGRYRFGAYASAALVVLSLLAYLRWPEQVTAGGFALLATFFGGMGLLNLRALRTSLRETVTATEDSIGQDWTGRTIAWQDIEEVRYNGAIQLIPMGGQHAVDVPLGVEGIDEILERVARLSPDVGSQGQLSRRRVSGGLLYSVAMALGLVALGRFSSRAPEVLAYCVAAFFGLLAYFEASRLYAVEFTDEALVLRYGFKTKEFSLASLPAVRLVVTRTSKGVPQLDVKLNVGVTPLSILPYGVDPFALFFALKQRTGGSAS